MFAIVTSLYRIASMHNKESVMYSPLHADSADIHQVLLVHCIYILP